MKDIAQDIAEEVPSLIRREQYFYFRRIFDNTADRNKGIKDSRMWIFDVDDQEHVELLMKYLIDNGMQGDPWCGIIPTLNGAHFLMNLEEYLGILQQMPGRLYHSKCPWLIDICCILGYKISGLCHSCFCLFLVFGQFYLKLAILAENIA